jgi:hypothetical protein
LPCLSRISEPLVQISGLADGGPAIKSNRYREASFELTEAGSAVLPGESDFIEIDGIDLWLGIHVADSEGLWRWDEQEWELVCDT